MHEERRPGTGDHVVIRRRPTHARFTELHGALRPIHPAIHQSDLTSEFLVPTEGDFPNLPSGFGIVRGKAVHEAESTPKRHALLDGECARIGSGRLHTGQRSSSSDAEIPANA